MSEPAGPAAALLMAYGAPTTLGDVAAFFTHIRGGRRPPEERIRELEERYRRIGDPAGLLHLTEAQAAAVQAALDADGGEPVRVLAGMRHSPPWIADRAKEIAEGGFTRLVGMVLAPHYSAMSVGRYQVALREALGDPPPRLLLVDSWHDDAGFISAVTGALDETLAIARRAGADAPRVIFTAHSLPERILAQGDPYRDEIGTTARLVAERCEVGAWEVAFQSASPTGEPWLGPDLMERIEALAAEGTRDVVIAPVGFVSDHLEILYDVDVLANEAAAAAGCRLWRTPSMNTRGDFIAAVAGIIRRRLAGGTAS